VICSPGGVTGASPRPVRETKNRETALGRGGSGLEAGGGQRWKAERTLTPGSWRDADGRPCLGRLTFGVRGWWVGFGRAKSGLRWLPSGVTQHSGRCYRLHREGPQPGRSRVEVSSRPRR
jgi:hypothetical protein